MKIRRLLYVAICMLLSVSVTVCWILDIQKRPGYKLSLDYVDNMQVFNDEGLDISLYKYSNEGIAQPVTSENGLVFNNMLPGDSIRFRISISNLTEPKNVKLILSEIEYAYSGTNPQMIASDILKYMYLIVVPEEGFVDVSNPDVIVPETRIVKLSDIMVLDSSALTYDVSHTAMVYNNKDHILTIPTTVSGQYVNLECRLWLDTEAQNCEDISLNIGKIVLGL